MIPSSGLKPPLKELLMRDEIPGTKYVMGHSSEDDDSIVPSLILDNREDAELLERTTGLTYVEVRSKNIQPFLDELQRGVRYLDVMITAYQYPPEYLARYRFDDTRMFELYMA